MRSLAEINQEYGQTCAVIGQIYAQRAGLQKRIDDTLQQLIVLETEAAARQMFDAEKEKEKEAEKKKASSTETAEDSSIQEALKEIRAVTADKEA